MGYPAMGGNTSAQAPASGLGGTTGGLSGDILGITPAHCNFMLPKQVWLPAAKVKGLEVSGSFCRRASRVSMEMTLTNRAMQPMSGFALQMNKNSFGLVPSVALQVPMPIQPNQSADVSLLLNANGPVQRMEPITNLQIVMRKNIDVLYFDCLAPAHVLFGEDGMMDKNVFLSTWKEIPAQNEMQFTIANIVMTADTISAKLQKENVFTVAKRNVDGQNTLYLSIKFINGLWALLEIKVVSGSSNIALVIKCLTTEVISDISTSVENILRA